MNKLLRYGKYFEKAEYLIFASFLLALLKISFPFENTLTYKIINDLLYGSIFFLWYNYFNSKNKTRKDNIISLILNAGIVISLMFLVYSINNNVIRDLFDELDFGFSVKLATTLVMTIQLIALSFILSVLKLLNGLKQKKETRSLFLWMVILIAIASIFSYDESLETGYLLDVSTILKSIIFSSAFLIISINSLKVSWIAFLSKKQKVSLLIISIVMAVLFIVCSTNAFSGMNGSEDFEGYFSSVFNTFSGFILAYGAINFTVIFFTSLFHLPTADAFDRKAEEVSTLMDLSKLITQVFDFKDLAETITEITNRVCNADISWLITKNNDELEVISVNNIAFTDAENITGKLDLSKTGTENINVYKELELPDKIPGSNKIKTLIVAPLKLHDKINGYLIVARLNEQSFDSEEEKAIRAFADYSSVALENAILIERSLEKERLEKELDVAREIQYKIIPTDIPRKKNLSIDSAFIPAFEVGGDYYDFFDLSDDKFGFVIADVSGKGIQAAFIMSEIKGIFESLSTESDSPGDVLRKANKILCKTLDKKSFVTAIYGIIDFKSGVLKIARAGHTPLIIANSDEIREIVPKGLGLGINSYGMFETTLEEKEIELYENSLIILYTDGITEAKNASGKDFGEKRLMKIIKDNIDKSVENISNEIIKNVSIYSKNNSQHDDITLVVMRYKK